MAELAAVASVVGITTPVLQGIRKTYEFIDGMRDAPSDVRRIASELKGLQVVLKSIPTEENAVPIVHTIAREMNLEEIIDSCDKACFELLGKLKLWMPDPRDPSFVDRAKVQFYRKTIRACRNIVRDTKGAVILAEVVTVKFVAMYLLSWIPSLTPTQAPASGGSAATRHV